MANIRKVVNVFLASPGDLSEERKTAKSVVDDFNQLLAEEFGYQVELVGWEDTVSGFGRPQAIINRDLERCELFVGMMWQRWGTPPDVKGPYTSGFEEEYRTSVDRRLREERPEISLFFKEIDSAFLRDPGDELKKVLEFKRQLVSEKKILFQEFTDIRDFEKKFRHCITAYIRNLRAQEASKVVGQSISPTTDSDSQNATKTNILAPKSPFSHQGTQFLREFAAKTERPSEQKPITAVEVARFRLLTTLISRQGNDEVSLGAHDANLLFTEGHNFEFGNREQAGLVICGLEHYSDENVPLWRWFAAIDGFKRQLLLKFSRFGSTKNRVGALEAMRLISDPLQSEPQEDRESYLASWLVEDSAKDLKVAALGYLGDCGNTSDLNSIRQQLAGSDNQIIKAATEAIIRINLRDSREKAILALYELQATSINQDLLDSLFDNDAALSTKILLDGVSHQNSDVRRIVVELLRRRHSLPNATAEQLLLDSDAAVKNEALKSLIEAGRTFSDQEAKTILVKQTTSRGLGGLFRLPDTTGEDSWNHFRRERLRSLKDKDLEEAAGDDPLLDRDPQFILAERHFKQYGEELRKSVDDQYKAMFSRSLHIMSENFGAQSELMGNMRELEEHIRKDLTRQGLDVICRKAEPGDLGRVRAALKSGFVDYSGADVEYLRRFGEWEDIPLIMEFVERPEAGQKASLLLAFDDSKYRTAAPVIYTLGRTRLPELLAIPMPDRLLARLITEISDKAFRDLKDVSVNQVLRSDNITVRKAAALKCVRALPKSRVAKLLADYVANDQHYYNVVHWLDFGVSTPRDRALVAVEKVINKEWRN